MYKLFSNCLSVAHVFEFPKPHFLYFYQDFLIIKNLDNTETYKEEKIANNPVLELITVYRVYLHPVIFLCILFFFKIGIFYKMKVLVLCPGSILKNIMP